MVQNLRFENIQLVDYNPKMVVQQNRVQLQSESDKGLDYSPFLQCLKYWNNAVWVSKKDKKQTNMPLQRINSKEYQTLG